MKWLLAIARQPASPFPSAMCLLRIRRKLKELPETIDRLQHRIHGLKADQATLAAHPDDRITIESQPVHPDDLHSLLGQKLDSLPAHVSTMRDIELGEYHGLRFGIRLNPYSAPDVFLAGTLIRSEPLTRQHQGPRAVLNAITRPRIDTPFVHQAFQQELTELRDQLKRALASDTASSKDDAPNAANLSTRIKHMLEEKSNPVESASIRGAARETSEMPSTRELIETLQAGFSR